MLKWEECYIGIGGIGKSGEKDFSDLSTLSSCMYKLNGIITEDGHGLLPA